MVKKLKRMYQLVRTIQVNYLQTQVKLLRIAYTLISLERKSHSHILDRKKQRLSGA